MFAILKAIAGRIKTLLVLDAVADLETELITRQAERKAELYRQAARYEENGQDDVAGFLRQEADQLSHQQPLQRVLPALNDLTGGPDEKPAAETQPVPAKLPASSSPGKRRKR